MSASSVEPGNSIPDERPWPSAVDILIQWFNYYQYILIFIIYDK